MQLGQMTGLFGESRLEDWKNERVKRINGRLINQRRVEKLRDSKKVRGSGEDTSRGMQIWAGRRYLGPAAFFVDVVRRRLSIPYILRVPPRRSKHLVFADSAIVILLAPW